MARGPVLTPAKREDILRHKLVPRLTHAEIALVCGVSVRSVERVMNAARRPGKKPKQPKKLGRPRKFTDREVEEAMKKARRKLPDGGGDLRVADVAKLLKGRPAEKTTKRYMIAAGYKYRKTTKKITLSAEDKKKRYEFIWRTSAMH